MAHQQDGAREPLIPKNDVVATSVTKQDYLAVSKSTKVALWITSLTAAISSHHTFKSTNFYKHFNLQRFDHELLVPITIIILHAFFAYMTRVNYLIKMRGPNKPHKFVRFMEDMLQISAMVLMNLNLRLLNDNAMITTAFTFAIFLICFLRLVTPGFGWKLQFLPAGYAMVAAYHVSRFLEFAPFYVAIWFVIIHFEERDDRIAEHQFGTGIRERGN